MTRPYLSRLIDWHGRRRVTYEAVRQLASDQVMTAPCTASSGSPVDAREVALPLLGKASEKMSILDPVTNLSLVLSSRAQSGFKVICDKRLVGKHGSKPWSVNHPQHRSASTMRGCERCIVL